VCVNSRARKVSSSSHITTYNPGGGPQAEERPITPLTYKQLADMARTSYKCTDEAFLHEVFNNFEACGWRDKHNQPINPGYMLGAWLKFRKKIDALADPDRLPDARKAAIHRVPHADNWRPMKKESVEHVF